MLIITSSLIPQLSKWMDNFLGIESTNLKYIRMASWNGWYLLFCSTSLPPARVLDGFDQCYQTSAVHWSKRQCRQSTSARSEKFLGTPGIKPRPLGAKWECYPLCYEAPQWWLLQDNNSIGWEDVLEQIGRNWIALLMSSWIRELSHLL